MVIVVVMCEKRYITSRRTLSGETLSPTAKLRGFVVTVAVLPDDAVVFCCRASAYIASVG